METDFFKQIVHELNDVNLVTDVVKEKFLQNPEETFGQLENAQIQLQDLITVVLMIEKLEENKLDNGLDLRHRLFSENRDAIALMERFLKDPAMTIENLK